MSYHLNLQLHSGLWSIIVSFSSLAAPTANLLSGFTLITLTALFSATKAVKTHCARPAQHQMKGRQSSDELVNIVEHEDLT